MSNKIEYRAAWLHQGHKGTLYHGAPSIDWAKSWIELERAEYPHDQHWIESRTVSDWVKVDQQDEPSDLTINIDIDRYALLADRFREGGETREAMSFMELTELLQLSNSSRNYLLCSRILCSIDKLLSNTTSEGVRT